MVYKENDIQKTVCFKYVYIYIYVYKYKNAFCYLFFRDLFLQ